MLLPYPKKKRNLKAGHDCQKQTSKISEWCDLQKSNAYSISNDKMNVKIAIKSVGSSEE